MGRGRRLEDLDWSDLQDATLAVDALFGIGLSRSVPPGVWGALVMAQESRLRLVAIDILSGICADSGRVISDTGYVDWPADLTVTFERAKRGHVLDAGARLSQRLRVVPIGLSAAMDDLLREDDADEIAESAGVAGGLLNKDPENHKYSHGHALILSGPSGRGGAARLAARGALRIGAGVVTVGCPPEAIPENAARLDAVMLRGVVDGAALAEVLEDKRINALCLGPGMGVGEREAELVGVAIGSRGSPRLVLDADALTILSQHPDLFAALHDGCVLTPHAGEFSRLFPRHRGETG
jgi:ADP-dependent NAD(P)H-hydrate dehydratase / NAD(P)H-hydrate epimerase